MQVRLYSLVSMQHTCRLTVRLGGVAGHATRNEASHMQVVTQKKVDRPANFTGGGGGGGGGGAATVVGSASRAR